MQRNNRAGRTDGNTELVREMYTFVTRIWRYRGLGSRPHNPWQAEVRIVEPAETEVRRVVGLKNLARVIQSYLHGRS